MISSAGADKILIEMYLPIRFWVSSEVLKKCSIKNRIGPLRKIITRPMNPAKIRFLTKTKAISSYFFLPNACATRPTVPILKKPKLQKIIVMTEAAILIAAKNFTLLKCPIRAVSTKPANGMAILEKKIGMDNLNKYSLEVFDEVLILGYRIFYSLIIYN